MARSSLIRSPSHVPARSGSRDPASPLFSQESPLTSEALTVNIDDLPRPAYAPPDCIRLAIPIDVVMGLVKDVMPIDATVIAAHFDATTNHLELIVKSDLWQAAKGQ